METALIEQIESFLEGNISREELEGMVKPEEVAQLDEKITWFKRSKLAIEAAGLQKQLKEVLPKENNKEAKVVSLKNYNTWYWVAASMVVLVVSFFGIYFNNQPSLYEKHLYVDPGLPILMSQSDKYQLYDAMSYYSEGNYEVAAQKLSALQKASGSSDTTLFYLGASLLYQGKTSEAILNLKEVQKVTASSFKDKADWLLVLAYLKDEQLDAVKSNLSTIASNKDHTFYNEAKKLEVSL
jgi:hypothetical protein